MSCKNKTLFLIAMHIFHL